MIGNKQELSENGIYFDKGPIPIRIKNSRFINHSHLSAIAPDFIPQLVIPDSDVLTKALREHTYPVEKINGPQWQQLIAVKGETQSWNNKEILPFTFKDHIRVAIQALSEIKFLFETYGLILTDRNPANIQLGMVNSVGHFTQSGINWKVYQVDFENVYDAITGKNKMDENVNLIEREGFVRPQNFPFPEITKSNLASSAIMPIITTIHELQTIPYFAETISKEVTKEIKGFIKTWNELGELNKEKEQLITIELALDYLHRLASLLDKTPEEIESARNKKGKSKLKNFFERLYFFNNKD